LNTGAKYWTTAALGTAAAIAAIGCGGGDSNDPSKVSINVTEKGKGDYAIQAPSGVEAGANTLTLDNSANKAPHDAQLVQLGEGHTFEQAAAIINNPKPVPIPDWIRAYGGVGSTNPGQTGTATVDLDEGHYAVIDDAENGAKQPPHAEFDVSGDNGADLPDADATVTAATTGEKDPEYEWQTDGLKAGNNTFTFDSQGKEALHIIVAAPIKGNATIEQVGKELDSNGPPKSIDFENASQTAILDGDKQEVTNFNLKAGRYAFICFLPDRDEPDKPHFKQGLLKDVTVPG
jgi:hypothetical protein